MTVVYTSQSGFTKEYAELLAQQLGLEVMSLDYAVRKLSKKSNIIYLGWLMAGSIKGLKKAQKKFEIKAVCAVGMMSGEFQEENVRKNNKLDGAKLFVLQGGFNLSKLHGINKLVMKIMKMGLTKGLSEKADKTAEETDLLDIVSNGGSRVSLENLKPVIEWCK